jgi:hypothetical protein
LERLSPDFKLLMRLSLSHLRQKAFEYSLSTRGTKRDLARRIAGHERKEAERLWKVISTANT